MSWAPARPCTWPGCHRTVRVGSRCEIHRRWEQRETDGRRGSAAERGYGWRWQQERQRFLETRPLCAECRRQGRTVEATVVDHIVPHKGDKQLFWSQSNWQPLCRRCHDAKTDREDGGFGNRRRIQI